MADRLRQRAASAFNWVAAAKLFERALGAVRIVIFARLLAPDDFGAFGIAALAVATLDRFTRPGLTVALVQRKEDVTPYLHSVWTFLLLRSWLLAGVLYAGRHVVAGFFDTPEAAPIMVVVAVATAVGGFTSLSLILLQRDLDLDRRFQAIAASGVADFLVALPLALVLRDPIALAYGLLARNACLVVVSLVVHPYRPRFSLDWRPLRTLREFAVHGAYQSWLFFVVEQGDDLFVGKVMGDAALGLYQVGYRMANILTQEVARMLSEVSLPVLSRVQDDPTRLSQGLRETLGATAGVVLPGAAYLALVAPDFILVALGPQWTEVVPAFRILLAFGAVRALSMSCEAVLTAQGAMTFMTKMLAVQLAVAVTLVIPLGLWLGLPGVGMGVLASQVTSFHLSLGRTAHTLGRTRRHLLGGTRGAFAGVAAGSLAVVGTQVLFSLAAWRSPLPALSVTAVVFSALYLSIGVPILRRDAPTIAGVTLDRWLGWARGKGRT